MVVRAANRWKQRHTRSRENNCCVAAFVAKEALELFERETVTSRLRRFRAELLSQAYMELTNAPRTRRSPNLVKEFKTSLVSVDKRRRVEFEWE